jgi:hypothetical protein
MPVSGCLLVNILLCRLLLNHVAAAEASEPASVEGQPMAETSRRRTWLDISVQDLVGMALRQRAQHGTHETGHLHVAVEAQHSVSNGTKPEPPLYASLWGQVACEKGLELHKGMGDSCYCIGSTLSAAWKACWC